MEVRRIRLQGVRGTVLMKRSIFLLVLLTSILSACASIWTDKPTSSPPAHLCLAPYCGTNYRVAVDLDASVDQLYGWNIQITSESITREEIRKIADSFATRHDGRKFMIFYPTFVGGFGTHPASSDDTTRPEPLTGQPWLAILDYMGEELVYENWSFENLSVPVETAAS